MEEDSKWSFKVTNSLEIIQFKLRKKCFNLSNSWYLIILNQRTYIKISLYPYSCTEVELEIIIEKLGKLFGIQLLKFKEK